MYITYPDCLKFQSLAPSFRDCHFGVTKLVLLNIQRVKKESTTVLKITRPSSTAGAFGFHFISNTSRGWPFSSAGFY